MNDICENCIAGDCRRCKVFWSDYQDHEGWDDHDGSEDYYDCED